LRKFGVTKISYKRFLKFFHVPKEEGIKSDLNNLPLGWTVLFNFYRWLIVKALILEVHALDPVTPKNHKFLPTVQGLELSFKALNFSLLSR